MASLLKDPLFETSGRAPAPSNNFHYFTVCRNWVIWRWWKISVRAVDRSARPGETKLSHQDFLQDIELMNEVRFVFGADVLEYAKALCQGCFDYLPRLSDELSLRIISYLEMEELVRLGQTSRRFRQLCASNQIWERVVRRSGISLSEEMVALAPDVGWRSIFFMNKLMLQKAIRRRRLKDEEGHDQEIPDPETTEEDLSGGRSGLTRE